MQSSKELFPSKRSEAKDWMELYPQGSAVTIDRVEIWKDGKGNPYGVLFVRELTKPISLNKGNSEVIEGIAGSEMFADWQGISVMLHAGPVNMPAGAGIGDAPVFGYRVFPNPRSILPDIKQKTDLALAVAHKHQEERRLQAANAARSLGGAMSGIGIDRAVKMMKIVKEKGKDWDWVKAHFTTILGMGEQIKAIPKPPDLPESMARLIFAVLKDLPSTVKVDEVEHEKECRALWVPSVTGEVIDKNTGEVIDMDDIPF